MTGRSALRLLLLAVIAGAVAPGVPHAQAQRRPSHGPQLRGTDIFPRGVHRVPDFRLRDQTGRLVTSASLRGRIFAVTFLDSICRKACPVEGRELASVQRMLGSHTPLTVVVVSVDPAADTPATARAFMRESRVVGPWHWLFGSRARLVPVWNEFGIAVQPAHGDINHATAVYLVDQLGWMRVADGVPFIPSQLAESVRALEK